MGDERVFGATRGWGIGDVVVKGIRISIMASWSTAP